MMFMFMSVMLLDDNADDVPMTIDELMMTNFLFAFQNAPSASRFANWARHGSRTWDRPSESCIASNASAYRYVLQHFLFL